VRKISVPSNTHLSFSRRLVQAVLAALLATSITAPAHALARVEPFATYQPQVSCDPVAKPGVVAFRNLILRKFGGTDLGISRDCEVGGDSEHKEGRAWDYGLNWYDKADRARAAQTIAFLTESVAGDPARRAKRLGVMYMIWNERIWSAYRAADGWRPYTGASPHRDHIHISFTWNGATMRSSWWTKEVMPHDYGPCPRWMGELAPRWRAPRLAPCPEPIQRPVADGRGVYRAQSGETVRRVARFFSITAGQVRRWNGLPLTGPVQLYVGQEVRVVAPTGSPTPGQDRPDER
jgi:hypothetical protein